MWNSGLDLRKSKGFVEIPMDNKGETSGTPKPDGSTETHVSNVNGNSNPFGGGLSEAPCNESHSSAKETVMGPSNTWATHTSRPSEFVISPTDGTNDLPTMPMRVSDNPVHGYQHPPTMPQGFAELPINDPGGNSTAPTRYVEPPMNHWQGHPSMSSGAAELPMTGTGGHSTMARGVAELPVSHWQGHPSTAIEGFVELSADQRGDHVSRS